MINEKIIEFIKEHHLLSLASTYENKPYSASCFYAFSTKETKFIIASDESTKHIKHLQENPNFSATIALETNEIGKIRGLQLTGIIKIANTKEKALYIKTFPYALALNPTLWTLHVEFLKFTDNRLGFGKKLIYKKEGAKLAPVN
ncbi:pyridoxamine 5'-phosphate oxidase family protein [Sulfurospirillum arcachonense]|uniref:pyridoxamine 5'-phosphate oxidase family protein n=1 Tax=Sulfurospirillum arcachonense TaxID=57666 RepID=UPI0004B12418|nr:pyridoxamine 5'-phosphate oxidase family protein [Sulfurospirillum arcachonense]